MDNRNLRDFIKNNQKSEPQKAQPVKTSGQTAQQNAANNVPPQEEEKIKQATQKYSRMNEQQLMNEMHKIASQNKQSGQLTAQDLEEFYKRSAPMLSVQQRNKLRSLINSLK